MDRKQEKLKAIEIICNKLTERNATLFLGSGINSGIKNPDDGRKSSIGMLTSLQSLSRGHL